MLELSSFQLETTSSPRAGRGGGAQRHRQPPRPLCRHRRVRGGEGAHLRPRRHPGAEPRRPALARRCAFRAASCRRSAPACPSRRRRGAWSTVAPTAGARLARARRRAARPGVGPAARRPPQRAERAGGARARVGRREDRPPRACRAHAVRGTAAPDAADRRGGRRRCTSTIRRARRWPRRAPRSTASDRPVVLIAGGDGKGQDFAPLRAARRRALPRRAADRSRRAADRARARRNAGARRARAARSRRPSRARSRWPARRRRAAVAGVREPRPVRELRRARRALRARLSARAIAEGAACVRRSRRRRAAPVRRAAAAFGRSARCRASRARCSRTTPRSPGRRCCCSPIGLVMVYSASIAMAEASAHTGYRAWYFLRPPRDCSSASAWSRRIVAFQVPMKAWQPLAPWLFVGGVVLLVLVLVPGVGKSVNGCAALAVARRRQPAAVGVHEARRRAVRGQLRGAQGRVPARRAAAAGRHCCGASCRCSRSWSRLGGSCCSSRTSARSSSSSRSRSASCFWAASTGACSSGSRCCCRSGSRRSSSRRRTGCSGSSPSSIRGRTRSARATSCRIR